MTLFFALSTGLSAADNASTTPMVLVVMDPLALELSCPCVKGYAQRDYLQLASMLKSKLGRPVVIEFRESIVEAQRAQPDGLHVIIGKKSVVEFDSRAQEIEVTPIAALTGKDGKTTQQGFIVVPANDPAKSVADLKNYRIIFGAAECDEKHSAALALLKKHGVTPKEPLETCSACSDGATMILELGAEVRAATVISSYAAPLLEGCGTIKRGDLRVVGTTEPVPFVTAFTTDKVSKKEREKIQEILLEVGEQPALCLALETQLGFVDLETTATVAKKK
jgi:ABC-type phosphate/phosphonate transport system substrate-binding protein